MIRLSRFIWPLVGLLSLLLMLQANAGSGGLLRGAKAPTPGAGTTRESLTIDGRQRTYLVHLPRGYDGSEPLPLVLVFHGGGGSGPNAETMSQFSPKADREHFIVVYPEGTNRRHTDKLLTWNAGQCCGYAADAQVNDVGFIRTLLDTLTRQYAVDPARIYATGLSNGGAMTHRLGLELSDRLAAIAPVGAPGEVVGKAGGQPISVLIIHGTEDQHVPVAGGVGRKSVAKLVWTPLADTVAYWVQASHATTPPRITETSILRKEEYPASARGEDVMLVLVKGLGHTWPGGVAGWKGADEPGTAFNATDFICEFFWDHPKRH
ncbi:MAG: hypothetical protein GEEBNDBF_01076 [bacterium]|nr:hypothetical protein [bacterium]